MKKLNVSNNEIDEKGILYLKDNMKSCKVEILDLSVNPIKNEGCIAMSKCLISEKLSEVRYINLSECNIQFNGVKEFFKYIRTNKKLDTILLNKNNLFSKKWIYLEQFLINLNLKHLGLNGCSLKNSTEDIAKILMHHPTLKILELSHNQINDDSFLFFKLFPKENLSLIELDFSRNYISDRSAKFFFEELYNNKSLQKLNFFDNQLQSDSANVIIESLKENYCLTYINLKSNRIPLRIINEINYRIQMNKLREKGNFLPKLKMEIEELVFEPSEINFLKNRIMIQNEEKKLSIKKLKEDNKMINLKKIENRTELNNVELQSNDLLMKLKKINKNINNEIELKEFEMNEFNQKCETFQKNIVNLLSEIDKLNIDKKILIEKYNDISKKMEIDYNTSLNEYEGKRKLLEIMAEQLKSKEKNQILKQRVLDRFKNPDIFKSISQKNIISQNSIKDESKILEKVNSDNNILHKKSTEIESPNIKPKSLNKRAKKATVIIKKDKINF